MRFFLLYLLLFMMSGCTVLSVQPTTSDPVHRYFLNIALGSEFGSHHSNIKKWNQPIYIQVKGLPTKKDVDTLKQVMSELSDLTRLSIKMVTTEPANINVYFVPKSQFSEIEPNYKHGNSGFFWVWWHPLTNNIYQARILISTTTLSQIERNHLIYEELTQSLGLMKDSRRYSDSIFYQSWSRVTRFSDMDKKIIQLLYHRAINSGMNREEVIEVLEGMFF